MENLADNGAKVSAAAAPLFSKVAGILASLLQKEPPSIIAPNFRSNLEEAVGLQVVNTPPVEPYGKNLGFFGALNTSWIVIGDFNSITTRTEKKGGRYPNQRAMNEFMDFINNNVLLDTATLGHASPGVIGK
ncbi:hypothetical protein IFM89_003916 [Coptis chinensis]|uniref:Endonuclease/exonuclease/phosphatase domain-containing protein n=1 Tax=Coptis chinensis TaxID=261450 RepID=A0A835M473_9MAGN|nr:hypothetical protein IFM89_003916 [Coptis chinensis]